MMTLHQLLLSLILRERAALCLRLGLDPVWGARAQPVEGVYEGVVLV